MAKYTIAELEKETCRSFGGNNCVLHQCMFSCVLKDAINAARKEKGLPETQDMPAKS